MMRDPPTTVLAPRNSSDVVSERTSWNGHLAARTSPALRIIYGPATRYSQAFSHQRTEYFTFDLQSV
jgi:hypothetical protein